MNEQIRLLLEKLVKDNGVHLYDLSNLQKMECQFCGASALGMEYLEHEPTCIVSQAKRLLHQKVGK